MKKKCIYIYSNIHNGKNNDCEDNGNKATTNRPAAAAANIDNENTNILIKIVIIILGMV